MKKGKKIVLAAAVLAAIAAAVFFFIIWNARKEARDAVSAFNAAAGDYNEKIAPYNKAVEDISTANEGLQAALDRAKADIDGKEKAYEKDTLEKLKKEAEKAQEILVEVPVGIDPFDSMPAPEGFSRKALEIQEQEAEAALAAVEEAETKIPEVPVVPDYSEAVKAVLESCEAYEKSVQKLKNVTCPEDAFVEERLKSIGTVSAVGAVSEKNDPNRLLGTKGGYTGCIYFLDERVDRGLLPLYVALPEGQEAPREKDEGEGTESGESVTGETSEKAADASAAASAGAAGTETIAKETSASSAMAAAGAAKTETAAKETSASSATAASGAAKTQTAEAEEPSREAEEAVRIGTDGGGAVEVYKTKEDAEAREDYLAFFDGSVMEAGSHVVEGTCVIRTSRYLEKDQQEELTKAVREALLEVK